MKIGYREKRKREIMATQQHPSQNSATFGRCGEIHPEQLSPKQKKAYDYILRERGMCQSHYRGGRNGQ